MKKILVAVVVLFLLSVGLTQAALININTVFDNVANVIQQIPNAVTAQFRAASFMATSTTATSSFAGQVSIPKLNADVYVDGTIYPQTNAGIQSAINKVCGAGGGTVVLSPATYLITTQINLCSNMRLTGYGSSTILKPQTNLFALQVDAKSNVAITNLMIDGQNSTNTIDAAGIRIKNSSRVRVDQNIIINQSAFAVFVDSSGVSTSSSIWITNNTLEGEGTNDVIGGGPQNSTGAIVKDVYVTGNNVTQDCTVGTYCNAFDLVAMNNFIVQGNIFYGIVQPGMEQFPHANLNITGNNIFPAIGKTSTALYISTTDAATATSSRIILANNNIKDGTIEVFGTSTSLVQNVVVSGNSVTTGSLQDGISFKYVNGASVTGNVIDGGESGIELATSSNFMIGGNSIANSNYGIKTDTKSTGITIGINRYTNILNQDVQSQPVVNLIRTSSSQTADFAIRDSLYDADGTAGKFYFSNFADRLGIYRGVQGSSGSERMRIDSSKVTFGDLAVQIRSLGVFDGIDVMRFNAAGNSFINNGFNLGLGTTTATERLHIAGGLRLTGNFMDSANATGTLGQLLQSTGTSTRWVSTSTLGFSSGGSGTVASGTAGQVAYYQTNGTSVVGTSTLFISTSSQVGVGITAPQATLDIASTTPTFRLTNTVNSSWAPGIVNGAIDFFSQDLSNIGQHTITSIQSINDIAGTPTSPSGALAFFTAINGTNTTEKMRLSSAGFLGLGTTTPDTMLSVVGTTTLATTSITSLSLGSLSGLLKATTGLVSVATAGTDYIANTIGDWTGTFDGLEGTAYLARANHTGTQLAATISDFVATVRTSISETITGLDYNNTTGVLSTTAGFNIPLTASTTNWNAFYDIPSTRITAGTNLSWSGNTLNATGGGSNWTPITGGLRTSTTTDFVQAAYFIATSTTGTSTFAGRVGIGTTSPGALLDLGAGDIRIPNGRLNLSNGTNGNEYLYSTPGSGVMYQGSRNAIVFMADNDANSNGSIVFKTRNNTADTSTNARMTIDNLGNVGIGTSTPSTSLQVMGTSTLATTSISILSLATSLNGILKATAGVVGTSFVNLASDVVGVLGVGNGGTGTSTLPATDQILVGNGTDYDYRRITAGTNVTVSTSTAGQIVITATGGGGGLATTTTWTVGNLARVASNGSVDSVALGGGLGLTGATINAQHVVNTQIGLTYTYVAGDTGKYVTHSNAAAIAGTLPQAGASFPDGWTTYVHNIGAGALTITPTISTINGAMTLVLTTGQSAMIVSNGTNYQAFLGASSGGGSGDMVLANAQTNSGLKTFLTGTFGLRNIANTFTALFSNTNTAARTYTLQDRDGTLADNTDLALKANLASPTFTGTVTLPASQIVNGVTLSTGAGTGNFLRGDGTYAAVANVLTGTIGQVPYYAGAGTTLTATSAMLINTSGAVAINGATTNAALNIKALAATTQAMQVQTNAVSDIAFSTYNTGDGFTRFSFLGDGSLNWGAGAFVRDVTLSRTASGTLNVANAGSATSVLFGIGSTTPAGTLGVTGTAFISSNITTLGNLILTGATAVIQRIAIVEPTAPAVGNMISFVKSIAGKLIVFDKNPLGESMPSQDALFNNSTYIWKPTTVTAGLWLGTAGAGAGTFANTLPTATSKYTTLKRARHANVVTTTNQVLGQRNTEALWYRGATAGQGGFFTCSTFGFDVWTNGSRAFFGLHSAVAVVSADPSALANTVGFAVDAADNGAISFLTRDATTATKASTGLTIVTGKGYRACFFAAPNDTKIGWTIKDLNTGTEASGSATLTLPTNTTFLTLGTLASNGSLTAVDVTQLGVSQITIQSDY